MCIRDRYNNRRRDEAYANEVLDDVAEQLAQLLSCLLYTSRCVEETGEYAITTTVSDRHILIDIGGSRSEGHFQTNSERKLRCV